MISLSLHLYIYFRIHRYMYRSLYQISIYACTCAKLLHSCPTPCKPLDVTHQAPLCMGFTRQEQWSGFPCPPPGALPKSRIEPVSLMSLMPALAGRCLFAFLPLAPPGKPLSTYVYIIYGNLWWLNGKESTCNAGAAGLIPGSGRSLAEGDGNPLQYLAQRISGTEETDRLQSLGLHESDTTRRPNHHHV